MEFLGILLFMLVSIFIGYIGTGSSSRLAVIIASCLKIIPLFFLEKCILTHRHAPDDHLWAIIPCIGCVVFMLIALGRIKKEEKEEKKRQHEELLAEQRRQHEEIANLMRSMNQKAPEETDNNSHTSL